MIDEKMIQKLVNEAITITVEKKLDSMIKTKIEKILDTDLEDRVSDLVEQAIDIQDLVDQTKDEVCGMYDLDAVEERLDACETALDKIRDC